MRETCFAFMRKVLKLLRRRTALGLLLYTQSMKHEPRVSTAFTLTLCLEYFVWNDDIFHDAGIT